MANPIQKGTEGALKETGIDKVLGIIKSVVSGLKPILNLLDRLTKMITGLLAPIFLAITILMMPLLKLLKPIAVVANKIMRPFLRLAVETLRGGLDAEKGGEEGSFLKASGIATLILLQGLSTVLAFILGELLKFQVQMMLNLIGSFIGIFFPSISTSLQDLNTKFAEGVDDLVFGFGNAMLESSGKMADPFVKETGKLVKNAKADFATAIGRADQVVADTATSVETDVQKELSKYFDKKDGVMNQLVQDKLLGANGLKVLGEKRVSGIIAEAKAEAARIIAAASSDTEEEVL